MSVFVKAADIHVGVTIVTADDMRSGRRDEPRVRRAFNVQLLDKLHSQFGSERPVCDSLPVKGIHILVKAAVRGGGTGPLHKLEHDDQPGHFYRLVEAARGIPGYLPHNLFHIKQLLLADRICLSARFLRRGGGVIFRKLLYRQADFGYAYVEQTFIQGFGDVQIQFVELLLGGLIIIPNALFHQCREIRDKMRAAVIEVVCDIHLPDNAADDEVGVDGQLFDEQRRYSFILPIGNMYLFQLFLIFVRHYERVVHAGLQRVQIVADPMRVGIEAYLGAPDFARRPAGQPFMVINDRFEGPVHLRAGLIPAKQLRFPLSLPVDLCKRSGALYINARTGRVQEPV